MKRILLILAACACACASAGVMSARFGALTRNDTVVTNVTDVTPGNYETVSNAAMSAVTTNAQGVAGTVAGIRLSMYPDASPDNIRIYASDLDVLTIDINGADSQYRFRGQLFSDADNDVMRRVDVAGAMSIKQDALPYPTNAIPYAAISGGQEWRVENQMSYGIHYVTNGMADVSMGAELSCNTNGWGDGAAMFVRFTIESGISYDVMDDRVRLVGYGTWPTNNFQSVWWRSGTNIFVNILLEE